MEGILFDMAIQQMIGPDVPWTAYADAEMKRQTPYLEKFDGDLVIGAERLHDALEQAFRRGMICGMEHKEA